MFDMQLQDTTLTCRECGQEFTFTVGDQLSHARKGQSKPSQCAFCRAARMMAGADQSPTAGRSSEQGGRQMYSAVCSDCGRQTTVPFEPRASRPVYCSHCYKNHNHGSASGGRYDRSGLGPGSYNGR